MDRVITIKGREKAYGREYFSNATFDLGKYGVEANSWLETALVELKKRSDLSDVSMHELRRLQGALDFGSNDINCVRIWRLDIREVGRLEARQLFHAFEIRQQAAFDTGDLKVGQRSIYAASAIVRRVMVTYCNGLEFKEPLTRRAVRFKTRWRSERSGRLTISHDVGKDDTGNTIPPIDALPHQTVKELKTGQLNRLQSDANQVIEALAGELEYWQKVRNKVRMLASQKFSEVEIETVKNFLFEKVRHGRFTPPIPMDRFIGIAARLADDIEYAHRYTREILNGPTPRKLLTECLGIESAFMTRVPVSYVLCMVQRCHSRELSAAYLLLMFHSAWNGDALLAMSEDDVEQLKGGYRIGSFKGKVDRQTPDVLIDREAAGGVEAIDLLLWNLQQQRKLKLVMPDEKRLWFSWPDNPEYPQTKPYAQFAKSVEIFRVQYGLPKFSIEQIRTHMLTIASYSGRHVDIASSIAGHASENTTLGYINQMIRIMLGRAQNLEFQRRLDNTVLFLLGAGAPAQRKIDSRFVDANLLIHVGDGTSCKDRENPPTEKWRNANGVCDGLQCHQGDGCPNNRIVLTHERVEEIFRLRKFYEANWKWLHSAYPEAFTLFHAPAMLFNIGLISYLKNSNYWPEIQAIVLKLGL